MALSNIFREPRREITETVVGIGIAAVALVVPYYFALWLEAGTTRLSHKGVPEALFPWPEGIILGVALELLLIIAFVGIHAVGEAACDKLHARGIHLRPRTRF